MSGSNQSDFFDSTILQGLKDALGDKINHIIELYLKEVPINLVKMQQSLADNDFVTLGRMAHSLKASSGTLGAKHTSVLCAELEGILNDGVNDPLQISDLITQIEKSFDQSRPMFSGFIN